LGGQGFFFLGHGITPFRNVLNSLLLNTLFRSFRTIIAHNQVCMLQQDYHFLGRIGTN
jgi:hypothetical protein